MKMKIMAWLMGAAFFSAGCKETVETTKTADGKEKVKLSLFSWPGYAFWYVAKEKNLVPGLELDIVIIEDPYESFGHLARGKRGEIRRGEIHQRDHG
jgi:ABC-type nitrate/sulfonate/bicarbonate transport system substrate-binding protein